MVAITLELGRSGGHSDKTDGVECLLYSMRMNLRSANIIMVVFCFFFFFLFFLFLLIEYCT